MLFYTIFHLQRAPSSSTTSSKKERHGSEEDQKRGVTSVTLDLKKSGEHQEIAISERRTRILFSNLRKIGFKLLNRLYKNDNVVTDQNRSNNATARHESKRNEACI